MGFEFEHDISISIQPNLECAFNVGLLFKNFKDISYWPRELYKNIHIGGMKGGGGGGQMDM